MTPLVTIITATYNSSQTLAWTIASVLQQDFTDFEYLIIGDACTDDSADVVSGFCDSRLQFINLSQNSGSQATPNNTGLELAKGQWIAYLGHDDLWFPWHLSSLLATAKSKNADFVYSMSALFSPQGLEIVYGIAGQGRTIRNYIVPPSSWLHRLSGQRWRDPNSIGLGVDNDFMMRWVRQNPAIAASERLSLLKYPSPWWRLYQQKTDFPQLIAIKQIRQDAATLEHQVLFEAAKLASQLRSRHLTTWQICKEFLKPTLVNLVINYPEFLLFRIYFQHLRKNIRRQRGLPLKLE